MKIIERLKMKMLEKENGSALLDFLIFLIIVIIFIILLSSIGLTMTTIWDDIKKFFGFVAWRGL